MSDPNAACPICRAPGPLAAPRHVAACAHLTAAEQFTLLARLGEALAAGAAGIAVVADRGHFHLYPGGAHTLRPTNRTDVTPSATDRGRNRHFGQRRSGGGMPPSDRRCQ